MAKELLTESDISITRIAERLSYSGVPTMNRAFKTQTGLSPSVWREVGDKTAGTRLPCYATAEADQPETLTYDRHRHHSVGIVDRHTPCDSVAFDRQTVLDA